MTTNSAIIETRIDGITTIGATINVNNVANTLHPGSGGFLLDVLGSTANMTVTFSNLIGDIFSDATSASNVHLEHNTVLNGAINENHLTGATGTNQLIRTKRLFIYCRPEL